MYFNIANSDVLHILTLLTQMLTYVNEHLSL